MGYKHSIMMMNHLIAWPWSSLHCNRIGLWLVTLVCVTPGGQEGKEPGGSPQVIQLALEQPAHCQCDFSKCWQSPCSLWLCQPLTPPQERVPWSAHKDENLTFKRGT